MTRKLSEKKNKIYSTTTFRKDKLIEYVDPY